MDISGEIQEVLFIFFYIKWEEFILPEIQKQIKVPVSEILSEEYFSWHGVMHMRNVPNKIVQIENFMF